MTVAATKSSVVDVVTEADRASEELIRSRIMAARPDDGFVGEEGSSETGTSGIRWVVDPIDGTVNFLYGIPAYAVSIAAQSLAGPTPETVAAVVLDVAHGTAYTATPGGGAFRDGVRLEVRAPAPMGERLVLTGFNYSADTRADPGRGRREDAAAGPRHPPAGLLRPRPVPRGGGSGGRVRRGGRVRLGPRRGCPGGHRGGRRRRAHDRCREARTPWSAHPPTGSPNSGRWWSNAAFSRTVRE